MGYLFYHSWSAWYLIWVTGAVHQRYSRVDGKTGSNGYTEVGASQSQRATGVLHRFRLQDLVFPSAFLLRGNLGLRTLLLLSVGAIGTI